jgi:hypothetical protein
MEFVMEIKAVWWRVLISFTVLVMAAAGCGTMKRDDYMDTERLLAASGFKMLIADTPEKLEHVKSLTQHEIIPHEHDGTYLFVYADTNYCNCMYVGNEEAYHRYYKTLNRENKESLDLSVMGAPEGFGRDAMP